MNKIIAFTASTILLTFSIATYSHSEHDKARFVAENGQDNSRCDNVLRPCKTIAYAVKQANKGDKVLVAAGHFSISSSEELFFLKSELVPIKGGYNQFDHFQSQSPQSNVTTLTNIPSDMTESMRAKGFNVIADGKSFENDKALEAIMRDYIQLSESQSNESCTDGSAGVFECSNIDLLAHLPLTEMSSKPSSGNDIWGHVDLNTGNEYALMGLYNGIIVVDVTDPTAPNEVGTISGVGSSWRDVKVYQYFDNTINTWQAYAYATTEGSRSGQTDYVTIIDLNNLPHSVNVVEKNRIVNTAHNVNISNVDYALNIALPNKTPTLQLVGANNKGGAFQSYSLAEPTNLTSVTTKNYGSGYTHDGAFIAVEDQRSSTDCGISEGSCTVYIDFNEKEMKLWDISDHDNTKALGSAEYDDVSKENQYVHSGWSTENHQYILLHDEFDEYRGGLNTTVRIFSIADLNNPTQVGQWTGPTPAIDHNGFVRGNRYYMSNYERGLTILDIADPASPVEVGFFDTYTPSNSASFNGAWGVYPFLPSGNILVSDINSGLYILKDNANTSTRGQFSFSQKQYHTEQDTTLTMMVERNASDDSQSVSVDYQVIQGSAEETSDFVLENGTLTWLANDNDSKSIVATIAADINGEFPESFFIRLFNPSNGATLGENSYSTIELAGIEDNGTASFSTDSTTIAENTGTFNITVNRIGSTTGQSSYNYALSADTATIGEDVVDVAGTLSWQDGENDSKTIEIEILNDDNEESNEQFQVVLTSPGGSRLGTNDQITIVIADDDRNAAPVVTLSENFEVNTDQEVDLVASANDSDNDDMTYLWEQVSGTAVTLTLADELSAKFTAPGDAGTLSFKFTATDFRGASSEGELTITVVEVPAPAPLPTVPTTNNSSGGGSPTLLSLFLLLLINSLRKLRISKSLFNK